MSARRQSLGRPFTLVWMAAAISSTGDGMFLTAFPLLAATVTRDPLVIAGVTVASRLPWLLFSLVAGAIVDRVDRRRLMVVADVVRMCIVGLLGVAVIADVIHVWLLYASAFLLGLGETFHANASQAIHPTLVEPEQLVEANARLTGAQVVTEMFAGPPLGAALFGVAPAVPFLVDGVTFACAAGLVSAMPDVHQAEVNSTSLVADMREGVAFLWKTTILRRLAALLGTLNFFYFATEAVLILYTFERLHSGKGVYSALFVAAALGTVATQWLVAPLERRYGPVITIALALWLWTVSIVALAFVTHALVAIVLFFILGAGDGLWRVLTVTMRQTITPNRLLGRVNSAYRMVGQGIVPLGAAFGGITAKAFGIRAPFVIDAVVFVAVSLVAPTWLRQALPSERRKKVAQAND